MMPDCIVQRLCRLIKTILFQCACGGLDCVLQPGLDPAICQRQRIIVVRLFRVGMRCIQQDIACSIPQFVAEVAIAGHTALIESDIAPGRGQGGKGKAQCIGAEARDACRKFVSGLCGNLICLLWLHQPRCTLREQVFQCDTVDQINRIQHIAL